MIFQYLSLLFLFSGALHLRPTKFLGNDSGVSRKPDKEASLFSSVSRKSQNSLLSSILGNTSTFISSMSQVDPTVLKSVINTLKELKATSESQEKSLLDAFNTKDGELGTASNNVIKAQEDLVNAQQSLAEKLKIEGEKDVEKNDASKAYEDGKKNFDSEQEVLGAVIAQLENLLGIKVTEEDFTVALWLTDNAQALSTNIGQDEFNSLFNNCPVVRGLRGTYVRISALPDSFNAFDVFANTWVDTNNKINIDFKLYDNIEDAKSNSNAWKNCNYNDPTVGFPRDCGKNSLVGGYRFFSMPNTKYSSAVGSHTNANGLEIYTGAGCPSNI